MDRVSSGSIMLLKMEVVALSKDCLFEKVGHIDWLELKYEVVVEAMEGHSFD